MEEEKLSSAALEKAYKDGYNDALIVSQPKPGHWIRWYEEKETDCGTEYDPHCKCSECGTEYDPYSSQFMKYCSKCGVRLEEQE